MNVFDEPPVNWVAKRAACNPDLTFLSLLEVVQRDVEEINKVAADKRFGYCFKVEQNNQGMKPRFAVIREHPNYAGTQGVIFEKCLTAIKVTLQDKSTFQVAPVWNGPASICELAIDGQVYEAWQVSERTLDRLFFEG